MQMRQLDVALGAGWLQVCGATLQPDSPCHTISTEATAARHQDRGPKKCCLQLTVVLALVGSTNHVWKQNIVYIRTLSP